MSLITEVSIVFYSTPMSKRGWLVQKLQCNPMFHCGLMFSYEDNSLILAADKSHRAKFVPGSLYHDTIGFIPSHIVTLGTTEFSNIDRIMNFISTPSKGDTLSIFFWFFIGRFIFKSYQPKSCALLACNIARFCGFSVPDFIHPPSLYKYIKNKYSHFTWEEYKKELQQ